MSDYAPLFEPFTLKGVTFSTRIAMAPMTRSFSPNGIPGDDVADYYARPAAADVGLLITEGTTINRGGASFDPKIPILRDFDARISIFRSVLQETIFCFQTNCAITNKGYVKLANNVKKAVHYVTERQSSACNSCLT